MQLMPKEGDSFILGSVVTFTGFSFCCRTAILLSVANGNIPLAKALINSHADVVKADGEARSPLSVALFDRNDLELSAQIVKVGGVSAVNHRIDKGSPPNQTISS